jgi:hypothetical protein
LNFVGSIGVTAASPTPCDRFEKYTLKERGDSGASRGRMIKVNRSMLGKTYQENFGKIDSGNQARLQGGSLETHTPTRKWPFRCYNGMLDIAMTNSREAKQLQLRKTITKADQFKDLAFELLQKGMELQGRALNTEYADKQQKSVVNSTPDDSVSKEVLEAHQLQAIPDTRTAEQKVGGCKKNNANYVTRPAKNCHICYMVHGIDRSVLAMCKCGIGLCNPVGTGRSCFHEHLCRGGARVMKRETARTTVAATKKADAEVTRAALAANA